MCTLRGKSIRGLEVLEAKPVALICLTNAESARIPTRRAVFATRAPKGLFAFLVDVIRGYTKKRVNDVI